MIDRTNMISFGLYRLIGEISSDALNLAPTFKMKRWKATTGDLAGELATEFKTQTDNDPSNDVLITEVVLVWGADKPSRSELAYITNVTEETVDGDIVYTLTTEHRGLKKQVVNNPPTATDALTVNHRKHTDGSIIKISQGYLVRSLMDSIRQPASDQEIIDADNDDKYVGPEGLQTRLDDFETDILTQVQSITTNGITLNAAEATTANERLFVDDESNFRPASVTTELSETSIKSHTGLSNGVDKLTDGKFATAYSDGSNLFARISEVDASDNVTFGTEVTLNANAVDNIQVLAFSATEFVVCTKRANSTRFYHCSVSGTTITASGEQAGIAINSSKTALKAVKLSATRGAVVFNSATATSNGTHRFTITGTVIASDNEFTFNTGVLDGTNDIGISRIDDDHALICTGETSNVVKYRIIDHAAATPVEDFIQTANASLTAIQFSTELSPPDDLHIVFGNQIFTIEATAAGFGTETQVRGNSANSVAALNYNAKRLRDFVIGYFRSNGDIGILRVNPETLTDEVIHIDLSFSTSANFGALVPHKNRRIFSIREDSTNDTNIHIVKENTIKESMFLALSSESASTDVAGIGVGGTLTNESGLISGRPYFRDSDFWGHTISATKVFITRNKPELPTTYDLL